MAKVLAIIPCFNEEDAVDAVVAQFLSMPLECDVMVVDDGSSDSTSQQAAKAGAKVVQLPVNLGIGGAVQTGYRYALRQGYDIAIQVDGDGQHPASEIPRVIKPLLEGRYDLVIGSRYCRDNRFEGRVSSVSRVIGGTILSWWVKVLTGHTIKDPTSGFRAANRQALANFVKEYPTDYPEPVSLIQALQKRLRVVEVPVQMVPRLGGISSIRNLKAVLYMIKVMWTMFLNRIFRAR